ncbi:MAG: hypothetical protein PHW82_12980 [Bacteroidales bacterium]|nr:hypothetical protein [Bacteroidales bacterium]
MKKQYSKPAKKKRSTTDASLRFKKITEKAQSIRKSHPKKKWKSCIKQASKELYK